ncbi:hypothetical protein TNCV_4490081 [Trichonephila clavipes]|nr:hypothetical protein TNCV_4490081 [Trichonephila clavipes]
MQERGNSEAKYQRLQPTAKKRYKEESRPSSEKRTQQGGPVRSRVSPTSRSKEGQAARAPEAEEVSNNIARRGQEERTIEDSNPLL